MVRRSQFEHLKNQILAEFENGLQPKDLYSRFPEVPQKTIRNWFQAQLPIKRPQSENRAGESISSLTPPDAMSQRSHLSVVDGDTDEGDNPVSDIRWIKRQLRNILRSEKNSAIRVQALNTFLRTIQVEASIRPTKPDINFAELSDQELERLAAGESLEAIALKLRTSLIYKKLGELIWLQTYRVSNLQNCKV